MIRFRDSIYQRIFAIIGFIACLSLLLEYKGLFSSSGLSPFINLKNSLATNLSFFKLPSVFLFNSSDSFIFISITGMLLILVLLASHVFRNRFIRSLLFFAFYLLYLSFVNFGSPFMNFQWDALLLEASFLFFVYLFFSQDDSLSKINIWLFRILIFKLMFMSGIVKLMSSDKVWWDCTALEYHYFTQPLPNPLSFFIHQLPSWFHKASCVLMFVIELVFPFFIFSGRRLRELAAWAFVLLQVIIFMSGNYGFFNLLTLVLCFSLFEFKEDSKKEFSLKKLFKGCSIGILCLYSLLTISTIALRLPSPQIFKLPASIYFKTISAFHISNPYGLFAMMTKNRGEIIIQGGKRTPGEFSIDWKEYKFKYKPQKLKLLPMQIAPLQPRLDWQMWFAALGTYKQNPWFMSLVKRLLENEKSVLSLLAENPFEASKPDVIRALYYDYKFSSLDHFLKTKEIWQREYKGVYLPEIGLRK